MSYSPNNINGPATSANSAPVVIASDQPAVLINDGENERLLGDILNALLAIASAKGILSDLRVSVVNTPATTATVTIASNQDIRNITGSITGTLGGLTAVGGYNAGVAVQNWQNQTAVQSFTQNVTRP